MAGSTRPGQFRTDRHLPLWGNSEYSPIARLTAGRRRFRTFPLSPRNGEVRPKSAAPLDRAVLQIAARRFGRVGWNPGIYQPTDESVETRPGA